MYLLWAPTQHKHVLHACMSPNNKQVDSCYWEKICFTPSNYGGWTT